MGSSESEINYLSFDIIYPLDITDLLTQPQGGLGNLFILSFRGW